MLLSAVSRSVRDAPADPYTQVAENPKAPRADAGRPGAVIRGRVKGDEILKYEHVGITTYVPKPLTATVRASQQHHASPAAKQSSLSHHEPTLTTA